MSLTLSLACCWFQDWSVIAVYYSMYVIFNMMLIIIEKIIHAFESRS